MPDHVEHFPPEIEALARFAGPFHAFALPAENCQVLFASYPAGTTIDVHRHPTNNVGVITKGQLILSVDGQRTSYGMGEWYHVAAEVDHAAEFAVDGAEIEFWFDA